MWGSCFSLGSRRGVPALSSSSAASSAASSALTHSFIHSLTHSRTHALTHSLTHARTHALTPHPSRTHALTHSRTHALTHARTHSLTHSLTLSLTRLPLAAFCVAGAAHRASCPRLPFAWQAQYTRGRCWARPCVSHVIYCLYSGRIIQTVELACITSCTAQTVPTRFHLALAG